MFPLFFLNLQKILALQSYRKQIQHDPKLLPKNAEMIVMCSSFFGPKMLEFEVRLGLNALNYELEPITSGKRSLTLSTSWSHNWGHL